MQRQEMERAAPKLGIVLQSLPIVTANEIEGGLRAAAEANAEAIVTMEGPMVESARARIVGFATEKRIPVMGELRPMTLAGGLMNYGPNQIGMWRRSAFYVDRILKGANHANLPVEQPIKFELVINLKTAKALGLTVPPLLLARADEVIE